MRCKHLFLSLVASFLIGGHSKAAGTVVSGITITGVSSGQYNKDMINISFSGGSSPANCGSLIQVYRANLNSSCTDCMGRLYSLAVTAFLTGRPVTGYDEYSPGSVVNCAGITRLDIN